jgi:GH15 family glucan-1,4-alpha-glucosidase
MERANRDDLPLSEYAIIGDGRTAALVATDCSVDWLCYGRFDGPAVFCRLLDAGIGGYFQIAPETQFRATRRYLGNTNVLLTEFECASGRVRVTDCMPLGSGEARVLMRCVEGVSGEVPVRLEFTPTFDFARAQTIVELMPGGCVAKSSDARMFLSCPAPMRLDEPGATSSFRVRAGEKRWSVLTHGTPPLEAEACEKALGTTIEAWERWSAHGNYPGPYASQLRRSALALKLLIYAPSGAMVAAPTTSLPETLGGVRNWDYRFTWLRDASWLVSALMDLGYHDESMAFIGWLESLNLGEGTPSVFYDLDGRVPSDEEKLRHLRGYRRSHPVRIGNAAAGQDQHDVFGEVVAAIHMCSEAMPSMRPLRPGLWSLVSALADRAAAHWEHRDHGMWEVRDARRHFLSSKLLSWVALDGAIAIADRDGLHGPLDHWRGARDGARRAILRDGFSPGLGSFRRALDQPELDASALLLPRYGIVPAGDPRLVQTVETVRRRLSTRSGLVRRYVTPDGLPGSEGAFTACSFWLADCLARQGRLDEAREIFQSVTPHASDVGLMSEEISLRTGELLGNYPQAFTHLALIRAAMTISRAEQSSRSKPRSRSGRFAGLSSPAPSKAADGFVRLPMRQRALRGAAAGAIATVAMSGIMLAAQRAGLMKKLPPEKITERTLDVLRIRRSESAEDASATVAHFGYGIGVGALFATSIRGRLLRRHPMAEGVLFAGLVWAGSYFGWVPAFGAMPPPTRDFPGRTVSMVSAHAVFGTLLGWLAGRSPIRVARQERA